MSGAGSRRITHSSVSSIFEYETFQVEMSSTQLYMVLQLFGGEVCNKDINFNPSLHR